MNKKVKYTFGGVNQDISKGKHPFQFYYEAQHIKLLATDSQSTGSATNEKGTELVISLPTVNIIGKVNPPIIANDDTYDVVLGNNIILPILKNDAFLYPVVITIITPPTKGTYTLVDNIFTYTNTSTIQETDSFVYQINDGFTIDTATVTLNILVTEEPPEDIITDSNYADGFYYYKFKPCDITLSIINIKSTNRIDDFDVYKLSNGWSGKIGYKINPIPTQYTILRKYGTICPTIDYDNTGGGCLVSGTIISLTNNENISIEKLTIGDSILSAELNTLTDTNNFNELNKWSTDSLSLTNCSSIISNIYSFQSKTIIINKGLIEATPSHIQLIYRNNKWVFVKFEDIISTDKLYDINGNIIDILNIDINNNLKTVFNIELKAPNYIYYANNILTHNKLLPLDPQ